MTSLIQKHADKVRFATIGIANTLIDFGGLFLFVHLGLSFLLSNIISTSMGLTFSLFMNHKHTFQVGGRITFRQVSLFLVVTLFGLWVIQPIVISLTANLLTSLGIHSDVLLFIGKVLATGVTVIWNYILYRYVVFKRKVSIYEAENYSD